MSGTRFDLRRQLVAEVVGTAFLLAAVVGSGIMAERLADGSVGLALLCNTIPTGAILVVIILMFGPVSGAHFNPAVTFAFLLRREIAPGVAAAFVAAQIAGGLAGTWAAHLMFDEPILMLSAKLRTGAGQWAGEMVATFGLVGTILACLRFRKDAIPFAVGLYITSAYWFTSSTSFANPAVTVARSLSNTFAGILPGHAPAFIAAQLIGAVLATWLFGWLLRPGTDAVPAKELAVTGVRRQHP
jgi:glycerol uptake facilitator-like aquaporin